MAKHSEETRQRIYELWKTGVLTQDGIAKALNGLVDRTTVQVWIKERRDCEGE